MGDVIYLAERRAARSETARPSRPAFFFDLACPLSYLAAERIERTVGDVEWVPAALAPAGPERARPHAAATRAQAETLAIAMRIPLVWPEGFPSACPRAMRAACHAVQGGAGARFALAAGRLAFCGGFDLEDPDILAEAAAAAGIQPECSLAAAADPVHDAELLSAARRLRAAGVAQLPAICHGDDWLVGVAAAAHALALRRPLRLSQA
jgi:2-hydroxychromene-2-carboxylate isomerase